MLYGPAEKPITLVMHDQLGHLAALKLTPQSVITPD